MNLRNRSWLVASLIAATIPTAVAGCGGKKHRDDATSGGGQTTSVGGTSLGGNPGSGGSTTSGGSSALGGNPAAGGVDVPASGGVIGSGGTIVTGGTTMTGGAANSGGASLGGGSPGDGGVATGGTDPTPTGGTGAAPGAGGSDTDTGGGAGVPGAGGSGGTGGVGPGGGGSAGTPSGQAGAGGTGGEPGACPTVSEFDTWDAGKSPAEIGALAVENFKPRTGETYGGDGYAWTFGYVGSLQFTDTIGDTSNNDYLISRFDCSQQGPDNSASATVDTRAFGDLPLEIFLESGSESCKSLGLARADAQWANPKPDGITRDARYWIDDMYMITSLQVFAYRATQDPTYLDRAALTMISYLGVLQQNNDDTTDGLFWHTETSHAYWGRANGWVASGMTELLLDLPAGADRDAILEGYRRQMDGLLQHQITSGTDVGAWRQVIDRSDAKPEMSCTAMFTFALATGVKNGWLTDPKYATAARNGWIALANRTSGSGALDQVCPGTGAAPAGDIASQQQFYMNINFQANDRHGQGPELWAATALLRQDCPGMR